MVKYKLLKNLKTYQNIYLVSNKTRFIILETIQNKALTITQISDKVELSFRKTAEYVSKLHKEDLVKKAKKGRNVFIKSNVKITDKGVEFLK